jgi:hypothetical protein
MASEVNRRTVSVEEFSSFFSVASEPVDLCLWVCTAFFHCTGFQPQGYTKQLTRVDACWSNVAAWWWMRFLAPPDL